MISKENKSVTELFAEAERNELFNEGDVEREMIKANRMEQIYNDQRGDLFLCTRIAQNNGDTFVHKPLTDDTHGSIMEALGFHGFKESAPPTPSKPETCTSQSQRSLDTVNIPAEWFWPRVSYSMSEKLLNVREENFAVIRTSQTNPGQFALTAGQCDVAPKL